MQGAYTRRAGKRLFKCKNIELPHSWHEFANQQRLAIGYAKILDAYAQGHPGKS